MPHKDFDLAAARHTGAHLLAAAVLKLWPDTKLTIGPAIDDGFYYDFAFTQAISDEDLPKIEATMKKLLPTWQEFTHREVSADEARELFKDNPYKLELIEEIVGRHEPITFYTVGQFTDLCRGSHLVAPNKDLPPFQLRALAGAYWRGDETKAMLTRVYGLMFASQSELTAHLLMLEEAKKRDHKVLGPQLGLFMFHHTSPGMPYWLPKGMIVLNELVSFWRQEHSQRGYHEISSPLINKQELWETSGHWEHYRDDMFIANMGEHEVYGVKAMNCPNAMIVFQAQPRSYRDLPLRLSDTDILHRYERSGTLNGLLRVRSFRQDDSHNFVTEDQIKEEYGRILDIAERFYGVFGLAYRLRLGTRPAQFLGDSATWDKAEAALTEILDEKIGSGNYELAAGDGAFYGPKIDIVMKDALGREWQMGTIQLDFQQPQRFDLQYVDSDGSKKTPVVIHRVIYGSLERFIGLLIEHYAGALPVWLSPVQVLILPIADAQHDYARQTAESLRGAGIRTQIDERSESIGKKIREGQMQKAPYMLIVGKKEIAENVVAVRSREKGDEGTIELSALVEKLTKEIANKE